jgi:hypothetical protein
VFRATSVSWPEAEELLWRTAFRVFALRCALASLLLALERRRIAHPKLRTTPIFKVGLQQGFATGEMGFKGQFARHHLSAADVRFGSKADMAKCETNVRFTPKSGHALSTLGCPLSAKSRHSVLL